VVEPGARTDADRVFIISEPGPGNPPIGSGVPPRPPFVNGSATPTPIDLVVGTTYRFRFILISANNGYNIVLRRGAAVEKWRLVARDGADLPANSSIIDVARLERVGAGMTFDYAYTPTEEGDPTLEVDPLGPPAANPIGQPTRVLIRVRARYRASDSP
jgi:hypothetical protein